MTDISKRKAQRILKRAQQLQNTHMTEQELYEQAKLMGIEDKFVELAMKPTKLEVMISKAPSVLAKAQPFMTRHFGWFISAFLATLSVITYDTIDWSMSAQFGAISFVVFIMSLVHHDNRRIAENGRLQAESIKKSVEENRRFKEEQLRLEQQKLIDTPKTKRAEELDRLRRGTVTATPTQSTAYGGRTRRGQLK